MFLSYGIDAFHSSMYATVLFIALTIIVTKKVKLRNLY